MKKTNRGSSHRITLQLIPMVLVLSLMLAACGAPATATAVIPQTGPTQTSATAAPTTGGAATEAATQASGSANSIKIGAVIPLTGRYAAGGAQVKNGYELAVADINAKGGVDVGGTKMPLELTVLDDESDATKTVQN